ncbi:MAG TPA: 1,4-alpha-glucan branching protein GlgB, partial [Sphingobacteriaceae bacterium]
MKNNDPFDAGASAVIPYSRFSDYDLLLFREGNHHKLYEKFGSHVLDADGRSGTYFAVWAPNARSVAVAGSFNGWNGHSHQLHIRWDGSGIWEGFIPGVKTGDLYKYHILTAGNTVLEKGDPFALRWEEPPQTASMVADTWFEWTDQQWMATRHSRQALNQPMSVYELHIGSWARDPADPDRFLTYRELAERLVPYIKEMQYTHVELMPVMEHPFYGSWGYQVTGYFAASSRFGGPQDLMYLIEELHKHSIGVILDWVPSHFPGDAHGLYQFDGTHLYDHEDPQKGFHPDWKSHIFNYGRNEVRSFLISNAIFWLDRYHADGLRIDAVASMLYLDYSRKAGEWTPNEFGGRENLEAIHFIKELNKAIYRDFPDVQTIAEESTSWPGVSRPTYSGGLGFGMKWMMGWMHDTLNYFKLDPAFRKFHHHQLTFSLVYAFAENFMLALSHDEVVHGKYSLINKMPGDEWQKFANLRALYLYMFTHPGTKLMFMGGEFGQTSEWNHSVSLQWELLEHAPHRGLKDFVRTLNGIYRSEPALYEKSFESAGFSWIDALNTDQSVFIYSRHGSDPENALVVILNLTPLPRNDYRVGLPAPGTWEVICNSDAGEFHGSNYP